jgi:predicted NBD/HSP70 family sugar kinase
MPTDQGRHTTGSAPGRTAAGPTPRTGADRDAPVRQSSLRAHNLALVLRQVAATGRPVSRADVAAATGLTRATVSTLVDELVRGRLVAEIGPAPRSGAGRPATGLMLSGTGPAGLGLEVNVDYLAACVRDLSGTVRYRRTDWVDQRGRAAGEVVAALAGLAGAGATAAAEQGLEIVGAAVAVPGLVQEGVVRRAPNLGWRGVPLGALLATALPGLPLRVENEANLAAVGEAAPGESFIYVSGEVGIGAGIILGGELFRGTHGWAGELGHVAVHPDGPPCHCGSRGCLEQYAGQEAILAAAAPDGAEPDGGEPDGGGLGGGGLGGGGLGGAGLGGGGLDGAGLGGTEPDGAGLDGTGGAMADVVARAAAGEARMLAALRGAGTALGVAVAGVVNLLDIGTVVLGGGYALLAPWLAAPVEREIAARVLTAGWSPVAVRASRLGSEATVAGAAGSVVRALREDPAGWLASR